MIRELHGVNGINILESVIVSGFIVQSHAAAGERRRSVHRHSHGLLWTVLTALASLCRSWRLPSAAIIHVSDNETTSGTFLRCLRADEQLPGLQTPARAAERAGRNRQEPIHSDSVSQSCARTI